MVGFKATDVPPTATVKFLGAGTAACIADLITCLPGNADDLFCCLRYLCFFSSAKENEHAFI